MKLEKLKTKNKLHCGSFLMPSMVVELKSILQDALESQKSIEIDVSEIESIDTLSLQLLISAKKSFEPTGLNFHIKECSSTFKENVELLGISSFLLDEGDKT